MKIDFRQGIVNYPMGLAQGQQFLVISGAVIDLRTNNGPTSITFAHRGVDYFLAEGQTVSGAWGPFGSFPVWLYWDIDRSTGLRTFGHTTVRPVSGSVQPSAPVEGLHWFDTANGIMRLYTNGAWTERIRVFAASYDGAVISPMGTNTRKPFAGTQVGLNNLTSFSGSILFDKAGTPVKNSVDGTFYTTETEFFTGATRVTGIRLESDVLTGVLQNHTPAYTVVKILGDGRVEYATYNDVGNSPIAITTQDGVINDVVSIILQGVITNDNWNWPTVGEALYVELNGELTAQDPHVSDPALFPVAAVPVARVISPTQIVFMQGLGGVGPRGPVGSLAELPAATPLVKGGVFLSAASLSEEIPIVFSTSDPLLAGAPFTPLTHVTDTTAHDAEDIVLTPAGNITSTDVESALYELDALIANVASGFDPKESVRVATTADLGATYNPTGGTGGTGSFTGAPSSIDSIPLAAGNRVLVKNQSTAQQNGIYQVLNAALGTWERSSDHDGSPTGEVSGGNFTFVEVGTNNANTGWMISADGDIQLNVDPINWIKYAGGFVPLSHLSDPSAHPEIVTVANDYTDTAISNIQYAYDYVIFAGDTLGASETIFRGVVGRNFTIPANATGSRATAGIASSGSATLTINRNGSPVGTINFNISATGTFTVASPINFVAGDTLTIVAPGTADGTLADVSIILLGTR